MLTPRCAAAPALRAECGRYGALNSFKPVTTENPIDDSSRYSVFLLCAGAPRWGVPGGSARVCAVGAIATACHADASGVWVPLRQQWSCEAVLEDLGAVPNPRRSRRRPP
jgi:hypothetical protein